MWKFGYLTVFIMVSFAEFFIPWRETFSRSRRGESATRKVASWLFRGVARNSRDEMGNLTSQHSACSMEHSQLHDVTFGQTFSQTAEDFYLLEVWTETWDFPTLTPLRSRAGLEPWKCQAQHKPLKAKKQQNRVSNAITPQAATTKGENPREGSLLLITLQERQEEAACN